MDPESSDNTFSKILDQIIYDRYIMGNYKKKSDKPSILLAKTWIENILSLSKNHDKSTTHTCEEEKNHFKEM